jgi:hypothetical protein
MMIRLLAYAQAYLGAAFLLTLSAGLLGLLRLSLRRLPFGAQELLGLAKLLVLGSLLLPAAMLALPRESLLHPSAQVYSGGHRSASTAWIVPTSSATISTDAPRTPGIALDERVLWLLLSLLGAGALVRGAAIGKDLGKLRRMLREMPVLRRHGRVSVHVSDRIESPFSAWFPRSAVIALPSSILSRPGDLRIALREA